MNSLIDALAGPTGTGTSRERSRPASAASPEPSFATQVLAFYPYPQPVTEAPLRGALDPRHRQVQPCTPGAGPRRRGQRED